MSAAGLLGLAWIALGLLVGWFVGYLADHLVLPTHHGLIYTGLGLSGAVLCGWAYGTRLLYLEVRAGLDEATSDAPVRRRTGYAWTAALAGPIVGLLLGLSSHALAQPVAGVTQQTPVVTVVTPAAKGQPSLEIGTGKRPAATPAANGRAGAALGGERAAEAPGGGGERAAAAFAGDEARSLAAPSRAGAAALDVAPEAPAAAASSGALPAGAVEAIAALAGLGLVGGAMLAKHLARLRRYQAMRSPAGARPPALGENDAATEAALRPLRTVELPAWIDAANRLLCARLVADPDLAPPHISVVRAGPQGIELLLDEVAERAPEGFLVADGGRCWRLDPSWSLEAVRAAAGAAQPYLTVLVPVGEDASGSYLAACGPGESLAVRGSEAAMRRALGAMWAHLTSAPWGEVACYRVGEGRFAGAERMVELSAETVAGIDSAMRRSPLWRAGLPDSQPVVFVEDSGEAARVRAATCGIVAVLGTMLEADRILCFAEDTVTIEPLGLAVPALLPSDEELAAVLRLQRAASAVPAVPAQHSSRRETPLAADAPLPVAGAVELRLLRPLPDLVGEVDQSELHPEVVQVVAYLALHDYKATTSKLRDVFGRYKRDESRATRTVWNATSHTRNVLGPHRFPPAHGNRPYALDGSVTCDWLRFRRIAEIGRAQELAGEPARAIETLRVGLQLIGDGYPCSEDSVAARYDWIDAEQLHVELETAVVRAAHSMASLSIEHRPYSHSLEDAAWAIGRGRVISPEALPLRDAALRLAAALKDRRSLDAEFFAAVDAVDDLALGVEVDPALEASYRRLGRQLDGRTGPVRARSG